MPSNKLTGRSGMVRLIALVVAVPVLGFAVYSIYSTFSEEAERTAPPREEAAQVAAAAPAQPAANSQESAAARSKVLIYETAGGGAGGRVVTLGMPYMILPAGPLAITRAGLLERELLRQAFLIAARDELGLLTRDEVLGEQHKTLAPAKPGPEILIISGSDGFIRMVIRADGASEGDDLLDRDLTKTAAQTEKNANTAEDATLEDLADLTVKTEELSRTELPAILRKLGIDGKPNATKTAGEVPASIANSFESLSFTSVFAAIKDLHALIRSDGESPQRCGALVRGYALLGLLTEFQWHPAHKAFKARSLLYAQRLVARDPKGAWGLWHRAFAQAFVGLHKNAVADLELAEARSKTEAKPARPTWVELVRSLARSDAAGLESKGGPHASLAAIARMTILEFPALANVSLPAESDVQKLEPDCFRAIDAMCSINAVSTQHVITLLGPQMLEQAVPRKLKAIASLPAEARAALEKPDSSSLELVALLEQSSGSAQDSGELSWSALAHLLRETQFIHVYRRLVFMKMIWNVPVDEFWTDARPWVAGHPLQPFLEVLAGAQRPALDPAVESFLVTNQEPTASDLFRLVGKTLSPRFVSATRILANHADHVVRDLSLQIRNSTDTNASVNYGEAARRLLAVSPRSQYAKAILIEYDPGYAQPHLAEWEKEAVGSPALLGALARVYDKLGKTEEAKRSLEAYIKLSPDAWAYKTLAGIYKKEGNEARWLAVLEQFIEEGGDPGLDQAHIRVDIANHYMQQRLWEKARPHADAAAQTGAGWAMICAQNCAEGRKDWTQAEQWARACSERYPNDAWDRWYMLCLKTGSGGLEPARTLAQQWILANPQASNADSVARIAWFYLAIGEPKQALMLFRQLYASSPSTIFCADVWIAADMIDDGATRDEFFKNMETRHRAESPHSGLLWHLFRESLDRDNGKSLDLAAVEKDHEGAGANSLWAPDFMVGMFLLKHGKPADARRYFTKSAENPYSNGWIQAVARDMIRKLDQNVVAPKAQTKAVKS